MLIYLIVFILVSFISFSLHSFLPPFLSSFFSFLLLQIIKHYESLKCFLQSWSQSWSTRIWLLCNNFLLCVCTHALFTLWARCYSKQNFFELGFIIASKMPFSTQKLSMSLSLTVCQRTYQEIYWRELNLIAQEIHPMSTYYDTF